MLLKPRNDSLALYCVTRQRSGRSLHKLVANVRRTYVTDVFGRGHRAIDVVTLVRRQLEGFSFVVENYSEQRSFRIEQELNRITLYLLSTCTPRLMCSSPFFDGW